MLGKSRAAIGLFCSPGTFITEWDDGAKACEAFLKEEETYRKVADKLVQISHYHGFDGWLVNIENTLSVSGRLEFIARGDTLSR